MPVRERLALAVDTHSIERVALELEGMTCASCATRIERRLNDLDGVEATVNYATDQAAVAFDPAVLTVDDLLAAVEGAGYHASLGSRGETRRGGKTRSVGRKRLVVAAVLTVPLVLV